MVTQALGFNFSSCSFQQKLISITVFSPCSDAIGREVRAFAFNSLSWNWFRQHFLTFSYHARPRNKGIWFGESSHFRFLVSLDSNLVTQALGFNFSSQLVQQELISITVFSPGSIAIGREVRAFALNSLSWNWFRQHFLTFSYDARPRNKGIWFGESSHFRFLVSLDSNLVTQALGFNFSSQFFQIELISITVSLPFSIAIGHEVKAFAVNSLSWNWFRQHFLTFPYHARPRNKGIWFGESSHFRFLVSLDSNLVTQALGFNFSSHFFQNEFFPITVSSSFAIVIGHEVKAFAVNSLSWNWFRQHFLTFSYHARPRNKGIWFGESSHFRFLV